MFGLQNCKIMEIFENFQKVDEDLQEEGDVFVTTDDDYTNIEIGDVTEKSEKSEKSYPATMSQSSSADTLSDMKNISPSHQLENLKIGVSEVRRHWWNV